MAHSHKARYARYRHHNIWWCKHVQFNTRAYPAKPAERASDDLDAQLHDMHLESLGVELDREISESTKQQIAKWGVEHDEFDYDDYYDPYQQHDWHWEVMDEYDYDAREYADRDYSDYLSGWSDDPRDAGWISRWVSGEVETPVDWCSCEYDLRDYDPATFEDDLDDEIRDHFEWLHEPSDTILVVEAIDLRNAERKRAGERHYQNHRRAA